MSAKSWSDRLAAAGAFLGLFGAYLIFGKGPAANAAQVGFRIGIAVLGVICCVAALLIKQRDSR